jgi:hypothetical protein
MSDQQRPPDTIVDCGHESLQRIHTQRLELRMGQREFRLITTVHMPLPLCLLWEAEVPPSSLDDPAPMTHAMRPFLRVDIKFPREGMPQDEIHFYDTYGNCLAKIIHIGPPPLPPPPQYPYRRIRL